MSRSARTLPVLMYRHVNASLDMITVSPQHFAAQMEYLADGVIARSARKQVAAFMLGDVMPENRWLSRLTMAISITGACVFQFFSAATTRFCGAVFSCQQLVCPWRNPSSSGCIGGRAAASVR